MNKKILVPAILAGVLFSSLSFRNVLNVSKADGTIDFDVEKIEALSHANGVVINFVNSDINSYWNHDASDYNYLKTLYEQNNEITSFADNAIDIEYVRNLYAKWDDFKPVNNVLSWRSNVPAQSYDVVVSLSADLTEAIYEAKGLTDTTYEMVNPYANTHYYWQVTANNKGNKTKSQIFDFYSSDSKRTVDVTAVSNTRDVGGFNGEFGEMKQGLIYRSGRLDDINEDGKEDLKALGVQTDLDLRNKGEGKENPANLPNYVLATLLSYGNDIKVENRAKTAAAMRVFTNPNNYPVMFHCAVGRDRTGTLGFLLQALCGASRDYIIHDYYTSMFSVTGAYQKTLDDLNLYLVNETLNAIASYGNSLSDGAEKFLTGGSDGLSKDEIQKIRDIWSGKTPVEHAPKTFEAEENYNGKAYVKIKTIGHKDVAMMVNKGSSISAPYELDSSLAYYCNGELFDFATPINDTTFIVADYLVSYSVIIHFVGYAKQDEIIRLNYGEVLTFNDYAISGYDMLILSDSGREISKLTVTRDSLVNIIYSAK